MFGFTVGEVTVVEGKRRTTHNLDDGGGVVGSLTIDEDEIREGSNLGGVSQVICAPVGKPSLIVQIDSRRVVSRGSLDVDSMVDGQVDVPFSRVCPGVQLDGVATVGSEVEGFLDGFAGGRFGAII